MKARTDGHKLILRGLGRRENTPRVDRMIQDIPKWKMLLVSQNWPSRGWRASATWLSSASDIAQDLQTLGNARIGSIWAKPPHPPTHHPTEGYCLMYIWAETFCLQSYRCSSFSLLSRKRRGEGKWFELNLYRTTLYSCTTAQISKDLVLIINIAKALEDTNWGSAGEISQFLRNSCFPIYNLSQRPALLFGSLCVKVW